MKTLGFNKIQRNEKFISVKTKYGIVDNVPVISWEEMIPYWPAICRAIFEVLIENDFRPFAATFRRPKGFVASSRYWEVSLRNPEKFVLSEAKYFIYRLKEKSDFSDSIRRFNEGKDTDWLKERNISTLGGYLYSFYHTLKPVLKEVRKGRNRLLKPMIREDD